jgi:beta-glucanase (GH16 family)
MRTLLLLVLLPVSSALAAPVKLVFATAPPKITINTCTGLNVVAESSAGKATPVTTKAQVNLYKWNNAVSFYTDSACKSAASASNPLEILAGASTTTLYVKSSAVANIQIEADDPGLAPAIETVPFVAAPPPVVSCGGTEAAPTTPPAAATAAGFSKLVFDDEFNSPSTISPGATGGYNWYPTNWDGVATPASYYSVSGGCLTINSDISGYSDALATTSSSETSQAWQHGYFEASIQYNPDGWISGAWPAFWSYSIEQLEGDVPSGTPFAELDFMECYPVAQNRACTYITTIHQWTGSTDTAQNSNNNVPTVPAGTDWTKFHTYAMSWTKDQVQWLFDGAVVTTVATGPGTPYTALENDFMTMILGTGKNWPMQVNWVHVWQ